MHNLSIAMIVITSECLLLAVAGLVLLQRLGLLAIRRKRKNGLGPVDSRATRLLAQRLVYVHEKLLNPYQRLYLEHGKKIRPAAIWAGGEHYKEAIEALREAAARLAISQGPTVETNAALLTCTEALALAFAEIFQTGDMPNLAIKTVNSALGDNPRPDTDLNPLETADLTNGKPESVWNSNDATVLDENFGADSLKF